MDSYKKWTENRNYLLLLPSEQLFSRYTDIHIQWPHTRTNEYDGRLELPRHGKQRSHHLLSFSYLHQQNTAVRDRHKSWNTNLSQKHRQVSWRSNKSLGNSKDTTTHKSTKMNNYYKIVHKITISFQLHNIESTSLQSVDNKKIIVIIYTNVYLMDTRHVWFIPLTVSGAS